MAAKQKSQGRSAPFPLLSALASTGTCAGVGSGGGGRGWGESAGMPTSGLAEALGDEAETPGGSVPGRCCGAPRLPWEGTEPPRFWPGRAPVELVILGKGGGHVARVLKTDGYDVKKDRGKVAGWDRFFFPNCFI